MRSAQLTVLLVLAIFAISADAWVAVGRRPVGFGRGVGVGVYRRPAVAVYRRPVFVGRKLFEEVDGESEKECPEDVVALVGDEKMNALADKCGADENFCSDCFTNGKDLLEMAIADMDPSTIADLADPLVVHGCAQAMVESIESKGVTVDEAFLTKMDECQATAAEEACPISSDKMSGDEFTTLGDKCLNVFHAASVEADMELDEASYCSDCYWGVLAFIVNDKALGDDFWCEFKNVNETMGMDSEEGEKKVFDMLYDDADFVSCSRAVVEKMRKLDENEDGQPDEIDPLSDPFAIRRQEGCWKEENKPAEGSILSDEMREHISNLECSA